MTLARLALVLLTCLLLLGAVPAAAQAPPGATCMNCEAELGATYYASARGQWVCSQECGDELLERNRAAGEERSAEQAAARAEREAKEAEAAARLKAEKDARNFKLMVAGIAVPVLLVGAAFVMGRKGQGNPGAF